MRRFTMVLVLMALVFAGMGLTGCPKQPKLAMSVKSMHFGVVEGPAPGSQVYETERAFQVWNSGAPGTTMVFTVVTDQPWIEVTPAMAVSTGKNDKVTVTVTINREYDENAKVPAYATGQVTVQAGFADAKVCVTTAPNYFTEIFTAGTDLDKVQLGFTPSGGPSYYLLDTASITDFPTDPTGGLLLNFGAYGDPVKAGLFGDATVPFYGVNYDTLYISSRGWISFGQPGNTPNTIGNHFKTPQISALNVDAAGPGSMVSYLQEPDRLVITYENAPTAGAPGYPNDFQVEMFFDGRIQVSYLNVDPAMAGVMGLSSGLGRGGMAPADFLESDLNTQPLKAAVE